MSSRGLALLLWPCLASCSWFAARPDYSIVNGTYALELVDGAPLPVPIESGDCPREIARGELTLTPGQRGTPTFYNVSVLLRLRCDPTRPLYVGDAELVRDNGRWTIIGDQVQFRSDQDYGEYRVRIEPALVGELGTILSLPLGGKLYTYRRNRVYTPGSPQDL